MTLPTPAPGPKLAAPTAGPPVPVSALPPPKPATVPPPPKPPATPTSVTAPPSAATAPTFPTAPASAPPSAPAPPPPPPPPPAAPAVPTQDGPLNPDQERFVRKRPGFEYFYVFIDWPANKKALGIVLSTRFHRVIVSNLKPGSLGEEKLKCLDRFVTVNGCPVSDKDVAKTIMVSSQCRFGAIVERPITDEAKKEFESKSVLPVAPPVAAAPAPAAHPPGAAPASSPSASPTAPAAPGAPPATGAPPVAGAAPTTPPVGASIMAPPPSVASTAPVAPYIIKPCGPDVQVIVDKHLIDRKEGSFKSTMPSPIIKGKANLRTDSKLIVQQDSKEVLIPTDTDPFKKLRKVNAPKSKK